MKKEARVIFKSCIWYLHNTSFILKPYTMSSKKTNQISTLNCAHHIYFRRRTKFSKARMFQSSFQRSPRLQDWLAIRTRA